MNFIVIPANDDEPITVHEASQDEAFNKMREHVGYIAVINIPADNVFAPLYQMYVDEDASFKPSAPNIRASLIIGTSVALLGDIVIASRPVVVDDEEGEEDVFYPHLSEEVKSKLLMFNTKVEM